MTIKLTPTPTGYHWRATHNGRKLTGTAPDFDGANRRAIFAWICMAI